MFWKLWPAVELENVLSVTKRGFVFWAQRKQNTRLEIYKAFQDRLHINVVITWQLSKQGIRWPVSPDCTAGSCVDPSKSSIFLKLSADKLPVSNDRRLKFIFSNVSYQICCVGPALLGFWLQTDLGRENSASFLKYRREDLFLPWSRVGHALRPIFMLWFASSWKLFPMTAEADRVLCQLVMY